MKSLIMMTTKKELTKGTKEKAICPTSTQQETEPYKRSEVPKKKKQDDIHVI